MTEEKKRSPNFTHSERSLLIRLANRFKTTIENKKTDSKTWKEKEEAWLKLTKNFNSCTPGAPRTTKQLIDKYKAIKKELKKAHSNHMKYTLGTGGGPYEAPPVPTSEEEKELIETIKLSVEGLESIYDSDGLHGISGIPCKQIEKETTTGNTLEVEEEIDVDWSRGTAVLWQTTKDPKLSLNKSGSSKELVFEQTKDQTQTNETIDETFDATINEVDLIDEKQVTYSNDMRNQEGNTRGNTTPASKIHEEEDFSKSKSWCSRRRPIIPKKKTVTSVAGKFELVATKKLELIELQKNIAKSKAVQEQKEHETQMEYLKLKISNEKLKNEILKKGNIIFEF